MEFFQSFSAPRTPPQRNDEQRPAYYEALSVSALLIAATNVVNLPETTIT